MKLCLFSCYDATSNRIKNYVKFYLEELLKYNDKVICITNNRDIIKEDMEFLDLIGVSLIKVDNEGFDFGMWYKILLTQNKNDITQLTLANDSCVLFRSLKQMYDWSDKCDYDYCGITNSYEKMYHIQSYFIIIKNQCVSSVFDYFHTHKIKTNIKDVIDVYEIGLSQYILNKGFKIGSYYDCKKYQIGLKTNIIIYFAKELIDESIPLIKKKVLFQTFRPDESSWIRQVGFDFSFDYKQYIDQQLYFETDNVYTKYIFQP